MEFLPCLKVLHKNSQNNRTQNADHSPESFFFFFFFLGGGGLAHLSRRLIGELIVYQSSRRLSVC